MSNNLHVVEAKAVGRELLECQLPVVVIYWDSRDTEHKKRVAEVGSLADEYEGVVKVLVIDAAIMTNWTWMKQSTRYKIHNTPTLQVFKTESERHGRESPGFIDRPNFHPGLRAMFRHASRP